MAIDGIKLIHATGQHDEPDDPSYPWELEVECSPPEFMSVAFIALHGGRERIVARGVTKEALEEVVRVNKYDTHPRLINLSISMPECNVTNQEMHLTEKRK